MERIPEKPCRRLKGELTKKQAQKVLEYLNNATRGKYPGDRIFNTAIDLWYNSDFLKMHDYLKSITYVIKDKL